MKSEILKELRTEKKITQNQLAKDLGVTRSLIGMIESGQQGGSREFNKTVAQYFDVSIDYLEGLTTDKHGESVERETLVSDFLKFLVTNDVIKDPDNIEPDVEKMILDMVKKEAKKLKGDK